MKIKDKYNKRRLVFIIILIIIYIVLSIINNRIEKERTMYKINENKRYVYTKYESTKKMADIPYINLIGDHVKTINDNIYKKAYEYLISNDLNKEVTYRYNVSKNIVSVVMIYKDMINTQIVYSFDTYVFDLKQDCKVLEKDELYNMFRVTDQDVKNVMEGTFREKYDEEVNLGYFVKTACDFKCYLELRDIRNNILDGAKYYVENSHLVAYRSFNPYSMYNEERYFTRKDFKFIIK